MIVSKRSVPEDNAGLCLLFGREKEGSLDAGARENKEMR